MNNVPRLQVCTTPDAKSSPSREPEVEVLLAEDNPADVYLIREALKEHSVVATVRLASDGKEVLQFIGRLYQGLEPNRVGLIILDLNLPRHDGIEILQHLRDLDISEIPVVVLTSSDSPRDRDVATRLGAARYLRKPSSLEQFLGLGAVFRELLDSWKDRRDA